MAAPQNKNKIIIFAAIYFLVVGLGVYYFLFSKKDSNKKNKFQINAQNFEKQANEVSKNENKLSSYDSEEVTGGGNAMSDYFKKIRENNSKKKVKVDKFDPDKKEDETSFEDPFQFGNELVGEDLEKEMRERDEIENEKLYGKYKLNTEDQIQDEQKQIAQTISNTRKKIMADASSKSAQKIQTSKKTPPSGKKKYTGNPKTASKDYVTGAAVTYRQKYLADPLFDQNDPYYFHYPLDSNFTYQPLFQYSSDTAILNRQSAYEKSLKDTLSQIIGDNSKNQKKDSQLIPTHSPTAKQLIVNQSFPVKTKKYPNNYFTENSSEDKENAEPYFFDADGKNTLTGEEVYFGKGKTRNRIKKLCKCEVVGDQFVRSGREFPVRIKENCVVNNVGTFPQGTVFTVMATVESNRINITAKNIILDGYMYNFRWRLYDTDALDGIYIHNYNKYLSIPAKVSKDLYSMAIRAYEAAVTSYVTTASIGITKVQPFEMFTIDRLAESGFGEMAMLSFIKEVMSGLENPAVFLQNQYKLYLDVSAAETGNGG